ncbi:MAG: phosphotransferase family protein, partial [Chloroflexi bacterium]|nr:phosphotransferase family protein [Chloroflexota bacterium]
MSQEHHKFEQVVQTIVPHSKLLRTWRRPGAATLKQNPHAAQDEFRLLQMTQSLGLATPTPYYLDPSSRIFATPYLVVEYIEGKPEFTPAHLADCMLQTATHLTRIHRVDGSHLDLSFLPKQAQGFAGYVGERPTNVDDLLDEGRIR